MEPTDDRNALSDQLADLYRDAFAPPRGLQARVWHVVQTTGLDPGAPSPQPRRWPIWAIAVPGLAAAALWLSWCARPLPIRTANSSAPDAAVFSHGPQPHERASVRRDAITETDAWSRSTQRAAEVSPTPDPTLPDAHTHEGAGTPSSGAPAAGSDRGRAVPRSKGAPPRESRSDVAAVPGGPRIAPGVGVLERVDALLRAGRAEQALAHLSLHRAALLAAGLGEEHDAYEILGHCRLGPASETGALRVRFEQQHPASLYADRVAAACAKIDDGVAHGGPP